MILRKIILLLISLIIFSLVDLAQTTTWMVTSGNDSGTGSLRQIISEASGADTIRFVTSVDTVFLTSGELLIDYSIVISGNQGYTCIIRQDTMSKFRIFKIQSTDTLEVKFMNLSITQGHAANGSNTDIHGQSGGGIYVPDSIHEIIFLDCRIEGNKAGDGYRNYSLTTTGNGGHGGGIYSLSKLQFHNCWIGNNSAGIGANASSGGDWNYQNAGSGGSGGAIYCKNDITIENCTINHNYGGKGGDANGTTYSSGGNGGAGGSGGALYGTHGMITMTNSVINNNFSGKGGNAWNMQSSCAGGAAGNGGGLFLVESTVNISFSTISENFAGNGGSGSGNENGHGKNGGSGGGIYLRNCQFNADSMDIGLNHSGEGGYSGGYTFYVSPGNGGHGGGIYSETCTINLENSIINGNYTGKGATAGFFYSGGGHGGSGGGIYILNDYEGSVLKNCNLENNYTGDGGKFNEVEQYTFSPVANGGNGGGLAIDLSFLNIINCVITGNKCGNAVFKNEIPSGGNYSLPKGGSGGGIYLQQSTSRVINSTIANNCAGTAITVTSTGRENTILSDSVRGQGGGIFILSTPLDATNSIFAQNYILDYSELNDIEGSCQLSYSLLSTDSLSVISGDNNLINLNPGFVSWPDDLSLTEASLCLNHGSPDTSGLFLPQLDIAGNLRIYGARIDMGAYEYQGEAGAQYLISTEKIMLDTVSVGGFSIDSLQIFNYGPSEMTILKIQTGPPFSVSMDKLNWDSNLYYITVPAAEPFGLITIFVRFDGLTEGFSSNNIVIAIDENDEYVEVSGYCKPTTGIHENYNNMNVIISPNPFSQYTRISLYLIEKTNVNILIFNASGDNISEIIMNEQPAGLHQLTWEKKELPAGIYFIVIKTRSSQTFRKLIIQ